MTDTRLNEHDKDEWRDVCRAMKPEMTDEEFEIKWADFQAEKARHAGN